MIACLDLEGVLVPEIWINVAEKTGIAELRLTTRDIPDYDVLMKQRLKILDQHHLKLQDIQEVIATMSPLEGAQDFLHWLQSEFQVIILSDTFYQFAAPLMKQLHYPTLFCHFLKVEKSGKITDYQLRMKDQKREAVKKLKDLNFKIASAGDSYNDIGMLEASDVGIFFCPPEKIVSEYPQFQVTQDYGQLKSAFQNAMERFSTGS
ncbi:MAG: bifunctional phosphoserine phosphatase/homoserine phosphotransferase ThrH [Deltaproteobacteria bacterium]|nr:bifunctional phosphoserine phosphatase/homoserine phosphotransferase ThrH [Deltaproteobacteria bacterium]